MSQNALPNTLPTVDHLGLSDGTKLVLEKLADGKIRVTSSSLVEDKVILPDQVREVSPTAAIIDSQSVKSAEKGGPVSIRMAMMRARRSKARSAMFS